MAEEQRASYGGQAVIEGVMIRGKDRVANACRNPHGDIVVHHEAITTATTRYPFLKWPFLRGTPALIDSFSLGYRTLMWSADIAMEGEEQEKPTPWQYFLTIAVALAFGIGVFVLLPTVMTGLIPGAKHMAATGNVWSQLLPTPERILPNIAEGIIRLLFLVAYIMIIGNNKEIRRVFSYHGAEHKVVNSYEMGAPLTVEGAKPFSRIHPRCGTSFLFLFFVVGILMHALIGWPVNIGIRMLSRIIMIPLIAGVSYELLRLAGRYRDSLLLKIMVWPGMALQQLTTAEPTDDQIEVALKSMKTVLEDEGVLAPEVAEAKQKEEDDGALT